MTSYPMFQVTIRGLTGEVRLDRGRRFVFKLDLLQLKPKGLEKVSARLTDIWFFYKYVRQRNRRSTLWIDILPDEYKHTIFFNKGTRWVNTVALAVQHDAMQAYNG